MQDNYPKTIPIEPCPYDQNKKVNFYGGTNIVVQLYEQRKIRHRKKQFSLGSHIKYQLNWLQ